jgi:hypothetical protein
MKVTCNIIKDILPLYAENMLSDDSSAMVEEHIEHCQECKASLDEMKSSNIIPKDTNASPLLKIKSKLNKKKAQLIILSAMLSIIVFVITMAFLTSPEYIPYSEGSVLIEEIGDGSVVAKFKDTVYGYDINSYPTDDNTGYVYHINTWNSIWNRYVKKSNLNNTILNSDGENVVSVYYYQSDGSSEDILIYGKDLNPSGGAITLPRLSLSYYSIIAIVLGIICGLSMFLFRYNIKAYDFTTKIFLLPISYLLAQLIIKGFKSSSYNLLRDLSAILLMTIPLYIASLTALNFIKQHKNKRYKFLENKKY